MKLLGGEVLVPSSRRRTLFSRVCNAKMYLYLDVTAYPFKNSRLGFMQGSAAKKLVMRLSQVRAAAAQQQQDAERSLVTKCRPPLSTPTFRYLLRTPSCPVPPLQSPLGPLSIHQLPSR